MMVALIALLIVARLLWKVRSERRAREDYGPYFRWMRGQK